MDVILVSPEVFGARPIRAARCDGPHPEPHLATQRLVFVDGAVLDCCDQCQPILLRLAAEFRVRVIIEPAIDACAA